MNAKTKNDPSRYISRTSLAGSIQQNKKPSDERSRERRVQELKNQMGSIDARWYIDLSRSKG